MTGKIIRLYADTSVFGGVFDKEYEKPSKIIFEQIRQKKFHLVVSALVRDEISEAPSDVKTFFEDIVDIAEMSDITDEAVQLQQTYLDHGILGPASIADALHVAQATVSGCRVIISWNFRHIVHLDKIRLYNGINRTMGYFEIDIHSPQEVIRYEGKDI